MLNLPLTTGGGADIGGDTGGTAGSVLFVGSGGVLAQDNANLYWDDTENRLGIGTNSPQTSLDVFPDTDDGAARIGRMHIFSDSGFAYLAHVDRATTSSYGIRHRNNGQIVINGDTSITAIQFVSGGSTTLATFDGSSRQFLLDNDGSASAPILARRADTNTGIYWSATDELSIAVGGTQAVVVSSPDSPRITVPLYNLTGNVGDIFRNTVAPVGMIVRARSGSSTLTLWQADTSSSTGLASTSGTFTGIKAYYNDFNPTSGDAKFVAFDIAPTINQTGTATGDYTALQINVTETAATGSDNRLIDAQVGGSSVFYMTSTGLVRGPDGSASTPTYSFVNDSNTGVFAGAADRLSIAAGGAEIAYFTTSLARLPAIVEWRTGNGRLTGDSFQSVDVFAQSSNFRVRIVGNRNAADSGTDVIAGAVQARTAGNIFAVQNDVNGTPANLLTVAYDAATTIAQQAASSGTPEEILTITGAAHTGLTASTEATDVYFNLARTVTFAEGDIALQRAIRIDAPTYAFDNQVATASVITDAATLWISGAPVAGSGATISNAWALYVDSGATRLGGNLSIGGNLSHQGTQIGFFGGTLAIKQTVSGSRGGNAALESLLDALVSYNLITDSTTA